MVSYSENRRSEYTELAGVDRTLRASLYKFGSFSLFPVQNFCTGPKSYLSGSLVLNELTIYFLLLTKKYLVDEIIN